MATPKEKKIEEKTNYTRQLLIWGAVVFGFWLLYLTVLFWGHYILPIPDSLAQHSEAIGVFGDYFGALNALFAGLAFAGLIVTIRQQSADLQATKKEMAEQTQIYKKQNHLLKKQIQNEIWQGQIQTGLSIYNNLAKKYDEYNYNEKGIDFLCYVNRLLDYYSDKYMQITHEKKELNNDLLKFFEQYGELKSMFLHTTYLIDILRQERTNGTVIPTSMEKIVSSLSGKVITSAMGGFICIFKVDDYASEECMIKFNEYIKPRSGASMKRGWKEKIKKRLSMRGSIPQEQIPKEAEKILTKFIWDCKAGKVATYLKSTVK